MAKTRVHRSIPFNRIAKMWGEGKTYEFMAKAVKRFDAKAADATKPMRAIISRMLTVGYTDKDSGKTLILKPREGMRAIGVGKKAPKSKLKAVKKVVTGTKKLAKAGRKGNIVIALDKSGKFIRIQLGAVKQLVAVKDGLPQVIKVVNSLGYEVTGKAQADIPQPTDEQKQAINETPVAGQTVPHEDVLGIHEDAPAPQAA